MDDQPQTSYLSKLFQDIVQLDKDEISNGTYDEDYESEVSENPCVGSKYKWLDICYI